MSRNDLWLNSHITETNANYRASNQKLTQKIRKLLKKHKVSPKEIAEELRIPTSRARNWYFRDTRITALDLLRLARRFGFMRDFVTEAINPKEGQVTDQ